ncbi:hypothetical protein BKG76_13095 [Mycobacteroides franklinii]|uniref:Uncharacterized protein n=1 Tax=Mycobacteroides franklinii TaxID=948102 RepID=A0A1S1L732_9MYCO|nr:hypothetical protein BKG76_13095 [Mycobacteroides franklinii]
MATWMRSFVLGVEALLQGFELVLDAGRQLVADELEPLFDERKLRLPLRVDGSPRSADTKPARQVRGL